MGATIYAQIELLSARHRRREGAPEIEITTLQSEVNAVRSFERRIASALKKEHVLCAPVHRPLPRRSTADERADVREAQRADRARRLARSEDDALAFFEAWHRAGHDPTRTFRQEAQTRKERIANDLARACVQLAATSFGVVFTLRMEVDEEHGRVGFIPGHRLAEVYVDPSTVARMAIDKIDTGARRIDGASPPAEPDDAVRRALVRFKARSG